MWDSYFNGVRCGIRILMVSDVGFFNISIFNGVRCGILSYFNGVRCGILILMVSDVGFLFQWCQMWDSYVDGVRCGICILMVSDVEFVYNLLVCGPCKILNDYNGVRCSCGQHSYFDVVRSGVGSYFNGVRCGIYILIVS